MSAEVTTLVNGVRVVTDPMDSVETVSIGVWVEAGARHERANINGISHLLEHMTFKGTRKRSARAIAEEIEAVGGHINAYTSREHTAYFAKVLKEDAALAIDVIADIIKNALIDDDELVREREVIVQEIAHADDTPDDIIFDRFQQTAYPEQALGWSVMGSADLVRSISRDTLVDYMKSRYSASNLVVSAAGHINHDTLVQMADEAFGALPRTHRNNHEAARFVGGDWRQERDIEQTHIVLGFEGISVKDPDFYTASVFSTLFGGGMSSRLFQEVREKRGLAYSIYSFLSCFDDCGIFGIYAGTSERDAAELTPLLCDEFMKVCTDVQAEEVSRAQAQLKASILMSLESTSSRCEQMARQLMVFDRLIPVSEVVTNIDAVDSAAVSRLAGQFLGAKPVMAALGPLGGVEKFEALAERLQRMA